MLSLVERAKRIGSWTSFGKVTADLQKVLCEEARGDAVDLPVKERSRDRAIIHF